MGLSHLIGLRDVDVLGGRSLPQALTDMKVGQRPKLSAADRFIAEAVAEQRVQDAEDRLAMLQKVRARQEALADEPDIERRRRLADRYAEAEILLTEKIK